MLARGAALTRFALRGPLRLRRGLRLGWRGRRRFADRLGRLTGSGFGGASVTAARPPVRPAAPRWLRSGRARGRCRAPRGRAPRARGRIDPLLDPLADEVARAHVGLGGQLLQRRRVGADRDESTSRPRRRTVGRVRSRRPRGGVAVRPIAARGRSRWQSPPPRLPASRPGAAGSRAAGGRVDRRSVGCGGPGRRSGPRRLKLIGFNGTSNVKRRCGFNCGV